MIIVITLWFYFTEKQFFYVIKSPTCLRYILHIIQGHPSGTNLLILNLKALRDADSFISLGSKSYIFGSRKDTNKVPYQTEFTLLLLTELLLRRSYGLILWAKCFFIISGAILFFILNIAVARACVFLWWIEWELSFFGRSWNEDDLSLYVILNALSWK